MFPALRPLIWISPRFAYRDKQGLETRAEEWFFKPRGGVP
jgi:hypothetical protein